MNKAKQAGLALAEQPEQEVEEVELAGEELDGKAEALAEGQAPQPAGQVDAPESKPDGKTEGQAPEQAAEPTQEPAAPTAGARAQVRLLNVPGVPAHFDKGIRDERDAVAAQADDVQAAFNEAAIARDAILDVKARDSFCASDLTTIKNRAFDKHIKAHVSHRRYLRAARALLDTVREYAKGQYNQDVAAVQKVRDKVDGEYAKVGRSRYHAGNVNEHPKVLAAEGRAQESHHWTQPRIPGASYTSREKEYETALAEVEATILRSVMEFVGIK